MPKTPDEIKKGLEITSSDCLMCECCATDCPYDLECHPGNEETNADVPKQMLSDALALIQQLQAQNAEQAERIKQLEAEWDETISILRLAGCDTCKYREVDSWEEPCRYCMNRERWQWRGVTKEE